MQISYHVDTCTCAGGYTRLPSRGSLQSRSLQAFQSGPTVPHFFACKAQALLHLQNLSSEAAIRAKKEHGRCSGARGQGTSPSWQEARAHKDGKNYVRKRARPSEHTHKFGAHLYTDRVQCASATQKLMGALHCHQTPVTTSRHAGPIRLPSTTSWHTHPPSWPLSSAEPWDLHVALPSLLLACGAGRLGLALPQS